MRIFQSARRDIEMLLSGNVTPMRAWGVVLTNRGFHAIVTYRISHALWKRKIPLIPAVLTRIVQIMYGIDIAFQARLGPGIAINHGVGLVIGSEVIVEGDCSLYHGVTLGQLASAWIGSDAPDGHPFVETNVFLGAGAKILGPVRIGQNSVIGANAVVNRDVPPNSIMVGVPARVVGQRKKR